MKKSEIYKAAQWAVVDSQMRNTIKLEILRVLMQDEDLAIYVEAEEQKKEQADEAVC